MVQLNFSVTDGNHSVYADKLHVVIDDIADISHNEESALAKALSSLLSLSSDFSVLISQKEIPDSKEKTLSNQSEASNG